MHLLHATNHLQTGESLVDSGHYASDEIESSVEELFEKWAELQLASDKKGVGLEQALSLVHFNRKVDGVQTLIHDCVVVASSQETGRDLEHCQVLIKKFDEFEKVRDTPVSDKAVALYICSHSCSNIVDD